MASGHGRRSRYRGALLGAAVGDALGARFEGIPAPDAAAVRRHLQEPGELRFTDDTAMTLGLARSLLARGGFDGDHLVETFARDFAREPDRGYGGGTAGLLASVARGARWDELAPAMFGGEGSLGNGASMRVAPAALFAGEDIDEVESLARRTASVTHAHRLGAEGAALQAVAVALAAATPSGALDTADYVESLRGRVTEPEFAERIARLPDLLGAPPTDVAAAIGSGVPAHEAVPAAHCAFLGASHSSPGSFDAVVEYAIRIGGDTDTIASMACAIAGAYLGEDGIPARWRDTVEGATDLRQLADQLASRHEP